MEQFLKKYKILREIGKGGMGIVYKALNMENQKAYAIKVLPANLVDRSTVERFNREAQAMAKLRHPNLVSVNDFGMTEGQHYYVMEFVDGETLRALVKQKGPLPLQDTLKIIVKTGEALGYAHQEGIIHRDIKPGNIMVTKDGLVKLMDFGLVKIPGVTKVTMEGSTVGTAEYMSPEQIYGEDVDTRSDIYSLGVTMYEALAGNPPFKAETLQATLMKHKYEAPPSIKEINANVPDEVQRIVMKAMSKDVATRYQKVQDMVGDINKFRGVKSKDDVEDATQEMAVEKKPLQKEKLLKAAFVVFLLVLAGLGVTFRADIYRVFSDFSGKISIPFLKKGDDVVSKTGQDMKTMSMADKYYKTGLQYFKDGEVDLAIEEYKKALRLRKDYGGYYRDLAVAYEEKGDIPKAVAALNDLLKYDHSGSFAEDAILHLEELNRKIR